MGKKRLINLRRLFPLLLLYVYYYNPNTLRALKFYCFKVNLVIKSNDLALAGLLLRVCINKLSLYIGFLESYLHGKLSYWLFDTY